MGIAATEREALCATLRSAGPDRPTLCVGWSTADLLAHLLLRESRPDAAPGIVLPGLGRYTARVQGELAARPFAELLESFRGLPAWWPTRLPVVDDVANGVELAIHHEDVRRAVPGWGRRVLPAGLEGLLARQLRLAGRVLLRRAPVEVELRDPAGTRLAHHRAASRERVVVVGDVLELTMFANGRRHEADVRIEASPEAAVLLAGTPLGL